MPSYSCPSDLTTMTTRHTLALVHVALISAMTSYMVQIKKISKDPNICLSSIPADKLHTFHLYKNIVFYSLCASAVVNLFYLAFQFKLSPDRWIPTMVYGSLFVIGVVMMGLSVDGLVKVRSYLNLSADCKNLLNQFQLLFILSISMNVVQAAICMWILKDLYIKITY